MDYQRTHVSLHRTSEEAYRDLYGYVESTYEAEDREHTGQQFECILEYFADNPDESFDIIETEFE